ncbi:MAG: hypothetical protein M1828_001154 [Chrysothrix sp. TS-e1954]|nr:MAG: hypothetical protein M1828_001154 [Chrysothrix sp. TS-e1954]
MPFNTSKALAAVGLLSCVSLAAPAAQTITANYDDLNAGAPVPVLNSNAISIYRGLDYQGFTTDAPGNSLAPAYVPQTPKQVVAFGGELERPGGHSIGTNFTGSTSTSFTPATFFWGAFVASEESEAQVASEGTLIVTGYFQNRKVATATFTETPAALTDNLLNKATLPQPEFGRVDFLTYSVENNLVGNSVVGLKYDEFTYTLH